LFINGSRLPAVRLAESLLGGSEPTSPKPFNRTDRRLTAPSVRHDSRSQGRYRANSGAGRRRK
jgi:hypothetical protein